MSPNEPTMPPTNSRRRILWLIVGHVVVGLIAACVSSFAGRGPTLPTAAFFGIVVGQTSLLGIWCGLGSNPWWQRVIGVVLGVGYLGTLWGTGASEVHPEVFFTAFLTTTFVAMPLLIVRFFKVAVQLDSPPVASMGRIQFSIRHLMILTFVVACLITIGKWVQPYLPHGEMTFSVLLFVVTFAGVGILPVWFVLATKQPMLYSVGLVAVGACAGYCPARILDRGDEGLIMILTATEAMAVVVSLLVVRSCGYLLVRLPPRRQRGR